MELKAEEKMIHFPSSASVSGSGGMPAALWIAASPKHPEGTLFDSLADGFSLADA